MLSKGVVGLARSCIAELALAPLGFVLSLALGCSESAGEPQPEAVEPEHPEPEVAPECTRHGVCDDGVFCNGAERCLEGKCVSGEAIVCDDGIECTVDSCDETQWKCLHTPPDADSDGHADAQCQDARGQVLGDDCDDADAARHPGARERCDARDVDEDCDFSTVGDEDQDEDGAVSALCCNATEQRRQCGTDCDDSTPLVGPAAEEVCDGIDNDCDGRVDEDVAIALYVDADGDQYGAGEPAEWGCTLKPGFATEPGDCDDSDPGIHPGAVENCDLPRRDRDCSGKKNDPKGGCACKDGEKGPCLLPGRCSSGVVVCANETWSSSCSVAPVDELCNDLDDDCDGLVDEDLQVDCYEDEDGDGYASTSAVHQRICSDGTCPQGQTHVAPLEGLVDCAPLQPDISPGAAERCNGIDDDCDGVVDNGLLTERRFIDADGDGYAGTPVERCAGDPSSASQREDCLDENPLVFPGQAGIFASPACAAGLTPCQNGAVWRCKPIDAANCAADGPLAEWDYDCDGVVGGEPTVDVPCRASATCEEGCGISGFLKASEPLSCGMPHDYQVCRCLGAQGGGCTESVEGRVYPCH